jgi:hypothetical protein
MLVNLHRYKQSFPQHEDRHESLYFLNTTSKSTQTSSGDKDEHVVQARVCVIFRPFYLWNQTWPVFNQRTCIRRYARKFSSKAFTHAE